MAKGLHTTIETLSHKLLQRWVPKWYEAFCDPDLGGFYERLGHSFKPIQTGQRRLLTQCRQLSVYSHAKMQGLGRDINGLEGHFDFIVQHYHVPDTLGSMAGGWIFSIDDDGMPLETHYDLYVLAFVVFAFSHYYAATGDERAKELAAGTLEFIDRHFRMAGQAGLVEAIGSDLKPLERVRRHESHMHLLEACLFAAATFHDPVYTRMAGELVDLFKGYFYDPDENILSEYFDDGLQPKPEGDHIIVEPGHYCEWIWLLKKHATAQGDPARFDTLCRPLLDWASTAGWDEQYGGIYDELNPQGEIIADTKRIWPLAEALKANALMLDSQSIDKDAVKARIRKMVAVFHDHYMQERGFWTEWLRRDLSQETDYMPGTTPYHVYFGIMETREVVQARGQTRSLRTGPVLALYGLRRRISDFIRTLRLGLKS